MELREHLADDDAASGLLRWQEITGHQVSVPSDAWRARGYTDATVASLLVRPLHGRPLNLVAKIVPAGQHREGALHRHAWYAAPQPFRDAHLVRLLFEATPTESGRVILFQELAGGTRLCRPASGLVPAELADCCGVVARSLLTEWNTGCGLDSPSTADFVDIELREPFSGMGSLDSWTEFGLHPTTMWITTPQDVRPLPNPVAFADGHPALHGRTVDVLCGHGHGDLHLENLLVRQDDDGAHPESFRLIDLSGYRAAAPLVRDQVNLLLSAVLVFRDRLSALQLELLLTDLVRDRPADIEQNSLVARLIARVRDAGRALAGPLGLLDAWHVQFTLALLAAALRFTSFENLGAPLRWWCFRLAAHAAAEYFRIEHMSDVDESPTPVTSPFHDAAPQAAAPQRSVPLRLSGPFVGGAPPGPIGPTD